MSYTLKHRMPLREGFDVDIELPRDLTPREAERLCVWIKSLQMDWIELLAGKVQK